MAKIMIIDDEKPVREALAAVIAAAGHETCEASDGHRALTQLAEFNPDLVITDILMPDMEGLQTICELRKRRPTLPILAMSGSNRFGGMDYLASAERLGATDSIVKPVSPGPLMEAVTKLLAGQKMRVLRLR